MSRVKVTLPCLYDKDFESKSAKSIYRFLELKCSKTEDKDIIVRKVHDLTRRYFDSFFINQVVEKWKKH